MKTIDLGRLDYLTAWDVQKRVVDDVLNGHEDTLILVEHEPVLTLGANFHEGNLLLSAAEYRQKGIDVVTTDRGGDVTYHGPGQLVMYPIFDLRRHGQDLHKWMRDLEETVIVGLTSWGINGHRFPPHTGAWVDDPPAKIAAIGVKIRKWVSQHGIALNCDNPMDEFKLIVPCGIHEHGVTSLSNQIGTNVSVEDAKQPMIKAFQTVFFAEW